MKEDMRDIEPDEAHLVGKKGERPREMQELERIYPMKPQPSPEGADSRRAVSRRSFLGCAAIAVGASALAATGLASHPVKAFAAMPSDWQAASRSITSRSLPWGFSPFDASCPWAKPTSLICDWDWNGPPPSSVENGGSSFMYTSGGTYWDSDIFLQGGRPYWVIGMEDSWNWFRATWDSVGTYAGRRVGCRMTVSEPSHVDSYNDWGRPSGWDGQKLAERYGARHFFVLAQTFSSELSHWLCGLAKVKHRFEFFYTDDPSRASINLDWAYYCCRSVQRDGGGSEWASPGANWQGHAFVPKGMNDSVAYWTTDCFAGWRTVATGLDEVTDRTAFMFDYSGDAVEFYRGDTVGWDGYNWLFEPFDVFHTATLQKRSTNPEVSGGASYSLAGAVYNVYMDAACTVQVGTATTDETGYAQVQAVNGTPYLVANAWYYVRESKAPQGYLLDEAIHPVYLDSDKALNLPEVPKTATVRFYVDGGKEPFKSVVWPLGTKLGEDDYAVKDATGSSRKPDCTPGLKAWYLDAALTKKWEGSVLDGDLDLYSRNVATLSYAISPSSKLTGDMLVKTEMDGHAKPMSASTFMPKARPSNWGAVIALGKLPPDKLFYDDGERWRTLRRRGTGWHEAPACVDEARTSLTVARDAVLYVDYSRSTYDGVVAW